jgi:hypothetical protein
VSQFSVPHRRAVFGVALLLLAWVTASRTSELVPAPTSSTPMSQQTIESVTGLLVIASDRPVVFADAKRGDGPVSSPAVTAADAGIVSLLALAREIRGTGQLISTGPLAFNIAPRGPPLLITA